VQTLIVLALVIVIVFGAAYLVAGQVESVTANQAVIAHEATAQLETKLSYTQEARRDFYVVITGLLKSGQSFSLSSALLGGLFWVPSTLLALVAYATARGSKAGVA
jgi:ABC-type dipeptide/oligopeptide/nickel transport system permease component